MVVHSGAVSYTHLDVYKRQGHTNVAEIERLMAEAKKKHEDLIAEYKKQKATLQMLSEKIRTFRRADEASGNWRAVSLREELAAEMKRTGYAPVG